MPSSSHSPPGCRTLTRMFLRVSAPATSRPRISERRRRAIRWSGCPGCRVRPHRAGRRTESARERGSRPPRRSRHIPIRATHVGVLAGVGLGEELLGCAAAHRAGGRGDDHVLDAEPREDPFVRVAVRPVRRSQALVGEVEAVGVLHDELAAAQDAGAGPFLVSVLRLDLIQGDREVLVGVVFTLDGEREHLLVGGGRAGSRRPCGPAAGTASRRTRSTGWWSRRGSRGSSAGREISCAPMPFISSRTTRSTCRSTFSPNGSHE